MMHSDVILVDMFESRAPLADFPYVTNLVNFKIL